MSKICRDLRAFSWGKFGWTDMICVKKLTFFNSDDGDGNNDDGDDDDGDDDYMLIADAQEWLSSGLSAMHIWLSIHSLAMMT